MSSSFAYKAFGESIAIAEELLKIEKAYYPGPPRTKEQKAVEGLRAGVVVMVVAALERFLRDSMEEHVSDLTKTPFVPWTSLPDNMRITNVYKTLDLAMKGPPFQEAPPKKDRLVDIHKACASIVSDIINPLAFNNTGANPNAATVKSLLKSLDVSDIFAVIKLRFEKKWGKPIAATFLVDKLNEIVNRRHVVAHTASALGISRQQLKESIKFVRILAKLIDGEIKSKINKIRKSYSP
ncbi:MAG: HEPN domain-containing protein [Syntrophorhabdaceae bacterium]|nr:HEPN domain-containing protein [Syntrophorhabdaceae bacterium]MDD5242832.1 HEPN domain-containing protein [Syntrophorhabdaceae bacterium]